MGDQRLHPAQQRLLTRMGDLLGGGADPVGAAWGSALGAPTTLRFIGGDGSPATTEIDVALRHIRCR
jgi:hypothetical protein